MVANGDSAGASVTSSVVSRLWLSHGAGSLACINVGAADHGAKRGPGGVTFN